MCHVLRIRHHRFIVVVGERTKYNQSSEVRTRDVFCGLERRTREKKAGK